MRNPITITFVLLFVFGTTVGAEERLLSSNPIYFPAPSSQFQQREQTVVGSWRLWVDVRGVEPLSHVPTFLARVYRARERNKPELVIETTFRGGQLNPFLSRSGQVLIHTNNQFTLYPVVGDPFKLTALDDLKYKETVYFDDDILLVTHMTHRSGQTQEVLQLDLHTDAKPAVLESDQHEYRPDNFVRSDKWIAWTQVNDERKTFAVRVTTLGKTAHDVHLTDATHPILDGIFGDWLLAHEGDLVYVLNLETNRELLLRVPGIVGMAHPSGILWRVDRLTSIGNSARMVWWNLVSDQRQVLLVHRYGQWREPEYQWTPNTLVISRFEGVSAIMLDAEPKPMDQNIMAIAEQRSELLRQVWTQQPEFVMRVLRDLHWPFGVKSPEILAEIAVVSKDSNAVHRAITLLGTSLDPQVRPLLLNLLAEVENRYVWGDVVKAVTRIGNPEDAAIILAYDSTDRLNGRGVDALGVVDALGILGDPDSKSWLENKRLHLHLDTTGAKEKVNRALRLLTDRSDALEILAQLRERLAME